MRVTSERVLIVTLFACILGVQTWNTSRINKLVEIVQQRTEMRWRTDNMQRWIDETQKRADLWATENRTSRFVFPSTEFR